MMMKHDKNDIWKLTFCMLGKNFRRWHFEIFFLFFLEKRIQHFEIFFLFFLEKMICHFMQTVSISMKCQILFSRKNKKNIISLSYAEFAHHMASIKGKTYLQFNMPQTKISSHFFFFFFFIFLP